MSMIRWSNEARALAASAAESAARLGHARVTTGHLLLALAERRTAFHSVIGRFGVPLERLERAVLETYDGPSQEALGETEQASELRFALQEAEEEAEVAAELEIAPRHLLLAATADDRREAYRALACAGLDVEAVRRAVADLARDERQGTLPTAREEGEVR